MLEVGFVWVQVIVYHFLTQVAHLMRPKFPTKIVKPIAAGAVHAPSNWSLERLGWLVEVATTNAFKRGAYKFRGLFVE